MFSKKFNNQWIYSQGFNMMVDFCIWVLLKDGLRVPSFDAHPDGDGSLRAAGLDEEGWRAWFVEVVNAQQRQSEIFKERSRELRDPRRGLAEFLLPQAHHPPLAWSGNQAVKERLSALWEEYGPLSNERKAIERGIERAWNQLESTRPKRLWDELVVYQAHLPTLTIHLVNYLQGVDYLIPPISYILASPGGLAGEAFRTHALWAAAHLAEYNAAHRRGSNTVPQPIWQRHEILPAPVQERVTPSMSFTRAMDEAQLAILAFLENDLTVCKVHLATVRFLKHHAIPGWQLYSVTFEDTLGQAYEYTLFLARHPRDARWYVRTCSGDRSDQKWRPIPARDHPVLRLQWNTSYMMESDGSPAHSFFAGGEVIDNGFAITRVRLIDKRGVVMEDNVEDGLVLYSADSEIYMPLQAELYNRENKLIWRQRIDETPFPFKLWS